ncbi:MAG: hypothetical protein KF764_02910 [Labilithrix sp.]|nr:hypothetical protein [Labilithrix sp.]
MSLQKAIESKLQAHIAMIAAEIVESLKGATLQELLSSSAGPKAKSTKAPTMRGSGSGALGRRTPEEIEETMLQIAALLGSNPSGLRAEQIKDLLNMEAALLARPIEVGLDSGQIVKTGQKRATTYFLTSLAPKAVVKKAAPKKAAPKKTGAKKKAAKKKP